MPLPKEAQDAFPVPPLRCKYQAVPLGKHLDKPEEYERALSKARAVAQRLPKEDNASAWAGGTIDGATPDFVAAIGADGKREVRAAYLI